MVWIHGGAFKFGDSSEMMYGPDYLLADENDVVFVSLNYRLGVLGTYQLIEINILLDLRVQFSRKGFLSIDDPDVNVPGNAGLKDQTMALKWVRENIHYFGGNNKKLETMNEI